MHRRRVREDQLDHADIDAEGHRPGALGRPFAAECQKAFAVQFHHVPGAEPALQHSERGVLRTPGRLADVRHVGDVQIDQVTERL
jgi:hypothetical protein